MTRIEYGPPLDVTPQEPQQVKRSRVSPLRVLDDEHGWVSTVGERDQDLFEKACPGAGSEHPDDVIAEPWRDIRECSERAGSGQRIAPAHEDPRVARDKIAKVPDERGLTSAGIAGDEAQPTGSLPRLLEPALESGQLPAPFEQLHARIVPGSTGERWGGSAADLTSPN